MGDFRYYPDPPSWSDITKRALEGEPDDLLALIPEREQALEDYLKALQLSGAPGPAGPPGPTGPTGPAGPAGGSVLVAGFDAPADVKAMAYSVCDGTADQVEINAAPGEAVLLYGTFNITATITAKHVAGLHRATVNVQAGTYNTNTTAGRKVAIDAVTVADLNIVLTASTGAVDDALVTATRVDACDFSSTLTSRRWIGVTHCTTVTRSTFASLGYGANQCGLVQGCKASAGSTLADCRQLVANVLNPGSTLDMAVSYRLDRPVTNHLIANNRIESGEVLTWTPFGSTSAGTRDFLVVGNLCYGSDTGIALEGRTRIVGNYFNQGTNVLPSLFDAVVAISPDTYIASNSFENCPTAIRVDAADVTITGNSARNCGESVLVNDNDAWISTNDFLGCPINDFGFGTIDVNNRV